MGIRAVGAQSTISARNPAESGGHGQIPVMRRRGIGLSNKGGKRWGQRKEPTHPNALLPLQRRGTSQCPNLARCSRSCECLSHHPMILEKAMPSLWSSDRRVGGRIPDLKYRCCSLTQRAKALSSFHSQGTRACPCRCRNRMRLMYCRLQLPQRESHRMRELVSIIIMIIIITQAREFHRRKRHGGGGLGGYRQWLQTMLFPCRLQPHTCSRGLASSPLRLLRRLFPIMSPPRLLGCCLRASSRRTDGPGSESKAADRPFDRISAALEHFSPDLDASRSRPAPPDPISTPPPPTPPPPATMLDLDVEAKSKDRISKISALKVIGHPRLQAFHNATEK